MSANPKRSSPVDESDVLIIAGYVLCIAVLWSVAWQAAALFAGASAIYVGWRRRRA